jgi:hypothetical protein
MGGFWYVFWAAEAATLPRQPVSRAALIYFPLWILRMPLFVRWYFVIFWIAITPGLLPVLIPY